MARTHGRIRGGRRDFHTGGQERKFWSAVDLVRLLDKSCTLSVLSFLLWSNKEDSHFDFPPLSVSGSFYFKFLKVQVSPGIVLEWVYSGVLWLAS